MKTVADQGSINQLFIGCINTRYAQLNFIATLSTIRESISFSIYPCTTATEIKHHYYAYAYICICVNILWTKEIRYKVALYFISCDLKGY